jgi:hypothetical protein
VSGAPQWEQDDPVRRRAFLMATGLAGSTLATSRFTADAAEAGPDPAAMLTRRLEAVLVPTGPIETALSLRRRCVPH